MMILKESETVVLEALQKHKGFKKDFPLSGGHKFPPSRRLHGCQRAGGSTICEREDLESG